MKNNNYKFYSITFIFLLLISGNAFAVEVNANAVDLMQLQFYQAVEAWFQPLSDIARWLLSILASISLIWMVFQHLINGADLQGITASLIKFIVVVGFAFWLINNAQDLSGTVLDGWINIAGRANTGTTNSVGQIFELGLGIFDQITSISDGLGAKIVNGFIGLIILIIYALITAVVFFIEVEIMVVTAAGVILLGFLGNPWTDGFAQNYLRYWMASGIKLFVLYLVVGAGARFVNDWASQQTYGESSSSGELIGMSVILLVLVIKIPELVQGLVSGSSLSNSSVGGAYNTAKNMTKKAAGVATGAAKGTAGTAMLAYEAAKAGKAAEGSTVGNAMKAVGKAGMAVAAGRITGGYKASHGSFPGTMAAHLRAERTGGAGVDVAGDYSGSNNNATSGNKNSGSGGTNTSHSGSGGGFAPGSSSGASSDTTGSASSNANDSVNSTSAASPPPPTPDNSSSSTGGNDASQTETGKDASQNSSSPNQTAVPESPDKSKPAEQATSASENPSQGSSSSGVSQADSAETDKPKKARQTKSKPKGKNQAGSSFPGAMTTGVDSQTPPDLPESPIDRDDYAALGGSFHDYDDFGADSADYHHTMTEYEYLEQSEPPSNDEDKATQSTPDDNNKNKNQG